MTTTQARATSTYLKWSKAAITFDRSNHANHIQPPGRFALVTSATVVETRLTKVLMDEGSGLNVLYLQTYDAMGLSRAAIRLTSAPVYGVIPEHESLLSGRLPCPLHLRGA
jgi:hypothetical protein